MTEREQHQTAHDWIEAIFNGPEVQLSQMLDARERRTACQRKLLQAARPGEALLSITLSIPGPHKTSEVLERLFDGIISEVDAALAGVETRERTRLGGATGPELLMLVDLDALELKRRMADIEETSPVGRLADLDVLGRAGDTLYSIQRTEIGLSPRRCLICDGEAKACARSRAHTVKEMQEKIAEIIHRGGYI